VKIEPVIKIMKKILLVDQDPKLVGDMQTKLAQRYEILATEEYATAYRILKTLPVDLLLARLPPAHSEKQIQQLQKLLKKLQKKKYAQVTRILTVSEGADYPVDEFMKLGIAAVMMNAEEAVRWIG
jgi:hypothetical protein